MRKMHVAGVILLVWTITAGVGGCGGPGRKLATPKERQVYYDLQAVGKKKNHPVSVKVVCEAPGTVNKLVAPYLGGTVEMTAALVLLDSIDDPSVARFMLGAIDGILQADKECPSMLSRGADKPRKYIPFYSMERVVLLSILGGGGGLNADAQKNQTGDGKDTVGTVTGSLSVIYGVTGSLGVGIRMDGFFLGNDYADYGLVPTAYLQYQFMKSLYIALGLGAGVVGRPGRTDVGFGFTGAMGYRWKVARRVGITLDVFFTGVPTEDAVAFGAMIGPTILI